jgi:hypothetical protein
MHKQNCHDPFGVRWIRVHYYLSHYWPIVPTPDDDDDDDDDDG